MTKASNNQEPPPTPAPRRSNSQVKNQTPPCTARRTGKHNVKNEGVTASAINTTVGDSAILYRKNANHYAKACS